MKKGILVLVLAGLLVLMFSSCSTSGTKYVLVDSVPTEQLTEVTLFNVGLITSYNGIAMNLSFNPEWEIVYTVKIPAGDTLFEIDIRHIDSGVYSNTIYRGKGALFMYNFLPNKQYWLFYKRTEEKVLGLNVYTFEIGEKTKDKQFTTTDPHFTAFVPFINNQGSEKTVLE